MTRDDFYMMRAVKLASKYLGSTAMNPTVGCIIVKNDIIIAEAVTSFKGRPHAEINALNIAGDKAKNATLYTTLEPCCHHGKSGPCTDAIIKASISKVVIANQDPNPLVNGKSITKLRLAGIEVITNIKQKEAAKINAGFFKVINEKRPFISLKIVTGLDGKIATFNNQSKWISSEKTRKFTNKLRKNYDALLVGINTIIHDDPMLTYRHKKEKYLSPIRVILDSSLRISPESNIVKTSGEYETYIYCLEKYASSSSDYKNCKIIAVKADKLDLDHIVKDLALRGVTRLLVEGGGKIHSAFLAQKLFDEILWIQSPIIIGNDGIASIGNLNFDGLDKVIKLKQIAQKNIAGDNLRTFIAE